jgi:hypothetical protein
MSTTKDEFDFIVISSDDDSGDDGSSNKKIKNKVSSFKNVT